jgi:hypothetical protein
MPGKKPVKREVKWYVVTGVRANEAFASFLAQQGEGSAHENHNLRVDGEPIQAWSVKPRWVSLLLKAHAEAPSTFDSIRFVRQIGSGKPAYADFFREMHESTAPPKKTFAGTAAEMAELAKGLKQKKASAAGF